MKIQFLGRADTLEKEMATHSSILAWEIPWTEESGGPKSLGSHKSQARLLGLNSNMVGLQCCVTFRYSKVDQLQQSGSVTHTHPPLIFRFFPTWVIADL